MTGGGLANHPHHMYGSLSIGKAGIPQPGFTAPGGSVALIKKPQPGLAAVFFPDITFSRMPPMSVSRSAYPSKSTADYMDPIIIIPFQVKRIIEIHAIWLKAIVPCVVVGWKIVRRQRAGIGAVRDFGLRINLLIFGRFRQVKIPVAGGKRSSDQHKPNVVGLFHNGVAGLTATIKILQHCYSSSYPIVIPWLFNRYRQALNSG